MSTSDDAALSAAINSVTDAATSAIRKTLRPADDTVSPDDLAAAQALVEATTAATVKAVQDAISALVVRPSAATAAAASPSSSPTMVTFDAVALRAALGLPPTAPVDNTSGAPVDNSSGAPVDNTSGALVDNTGPDLSSLFTALGLNPPQQHDNLPAGFASGGAPSGADAVDALHAQAVSVLNVKALVPVVLDLGSANYSKCRCLFLITLSKYALSDHILSDAFPNNGAWARMDCVVLAWLYGTIAADLLETVLQPVVTARQVWLCLEQMFLGHHEQRAMQVSAEFHHFEQGDLSANNYCRRLKALAGHSRRARRPRHRQTTRPRDASMS